MSQTAGRLGYYNTMKHRFKLAYNEIVSVSNNIFH